jgi:hypothetical protein
MSAGDVVRRACQQAQMSDTALVSLREGLITPADYRNIVEGDPEPEHEAE